MASPHHVETARRDGTLFGLPLGDLGWFQSLLMGLATGFGAFFVATFFSIVGLLFYSTFSHKAVDFAIAYKRIGFPIGVGVGIAALTFLGFQWVRRLARKGRGL
jgi:hypothetical protein